MLLPYKRERITEGLTVKVSNHFFYDDFGVRDEGEMRYYGRRYVMSDTPGTGFIEHESESHSYHNYVRDGLAKQKHKWWRLVTGKEPSYRKELKRATAAMEQCTDPKKRQILECYVNALTVGRSEEKMQRIVRGIKDKMGHHSNKYMVSVMSHYKNKIHQLGHDMTAVEYHVKDHCSAAVYNAYLEMTEAFVKVANCRRMWCQDDKAKGGFAQVFFDLGIFDFIRSDGFLPIIRDGKGISYYLLPDSVIVARSSVDFDILPLKNLTIVCQEMAIEEPVDVLSSLLGDAASMIKIPEFNLTFYFNHVRPIVEFVNSIDRLKETLNGE
ncbi:MAG: hypothetical protein J6W88_02115 [Bacteroidales bacterium]|nr:hypothetical protein [Bacteroidales bacterium]